MGILRPHMQPDGGMVEIDSDLIDQLHNGYAPLGWEGDPQLFLAWNRQDQRIELWRYANNGTGEAFMVLRGPVGMRVADLRVIDFLVKHDTRRGYDPVQDIAKHNAQVKKDALAAQDDKMGEAADRLLSAFQKDVGRHVTGLSKSHYELPEAPWKKDKK